MPLGTPPAETMKFEMPMGKMNFKASTKKAKKPVKQAGSGEAEPLAEPPRMNQNQFAELNGRGTRQPLEGRANRFALPEGERPGPRLPSSGGLPNRQRLFASTREGAANVGFVTPGRNRALPGPEGIRRPQDEGRRTPTPRQQPDYPMHYRTLGVKEGASPEEITAAFRKLSRQFHPDMLSKDASPQKRAAANKKMGELTAAYSALKTRRV